jgi:uncharacterized protein (UPF0371 family)
MYYVERMTSADTIEYRKIGFDSNLYRDIQAEKIAHRVQEFKGGRLYLEIGGKFLFDGHASRVLPGFNPKVKVDIMKKVGIPFDLIFCVNAQDILSNRFLNTDSTSYIGYVDTLLEDFEKAFNHKPAISINLINSENSSKALEYRERMEEKGYKVFNRYHIDGYPDTKSIVSKEGYGKDEHIEDLNKLVLVVGAASNSGKMSTCLGQIYNDHVKGIESGYAKYETFPIWNLPLLHPVNLAYESATVDIGDYNMIDKYHLYHYGITSVNYNRDVAAFTIVENMIKQMVSTDNFISTYKSPTDMGVNTVLDGITNDEIVSIASYNEILRRKSWYYDLRNEKPNAIKWSDRCEQLAVKAKKYIDKKKYNINLDLLN